MLDVNVQRGGARTFLKEARDRLETLRFEATIGTDATARFTCTLDLTECVFDLQTPKRSYFSLDEAIHMCYTLSQFPSRWQTVR